MSVNASFEDVEQYPTVEEKAARLCYALIGNHPFMDGNKRVGVLAMLMTFRLNGVTLEYSQQELIDLGVSIANGKMRYSKVLAWVLMHKP